jgi:PIN domain nuclease of toxin-antitoxin system
MKLLLDTHTFIWFVFNAPEMPAATRDLLEDAASELYFSHASVWEMAIKVSIGKLSFSTKVTDLVSH